MPLYDGGGAGENRDRFYFMDVHNMWDMLQHHDTAPHQQALKGWRQSYELVLMHKTQVEKYREKLITAWPPERSKAARAYIERLDHLIESLGETYDAAIANYSAYSTAIAAVDDAKYKLQTIQQEQAANADALTKYANEMRDRPRAYGKAIAPPPPPSPVAEGRQEQLRLQAADLMTGLSAELATAQMSLTAPKPYSPGVKVENSGDGFDPGSISVPAIMPAVSTPSAGSTRSSRSPSTQPDTRVDAANPDKGKSDRPSTIKKPPQGPILGEAKPQLPPTARTPLTPTASTPTTNLSIPPSFTPSQGPPSTSLPRPPGIMGSPLVANPTSTGIRGTSPLNGGIIGGTPPVGGSPSNQARQSGNATRSTQRVNPLGGVIGQSTPASPGRRSAIHAEHESRSSSWDPDNPWETASGMDPVLLPQPEQRINPGPTIGGR
jgi:hypothetical protein